MNVLFMARLYWPHVGGVEKHVYEISQRLKVKGQNIIIVTEKYDSKLPSYEIHDGVEIHRIPANNKWQVWKWMWLHGELLNWADVIHAHDVYFWIIPYKLLHPFKKTFVTFHGWEGIYPIPWKNIVVRRISEILANGNICVGDYVAKWYGTKPDFITYGAA